jgi:heptosyltransferase III
MLRRNVLIFQPGALGDFVLSWPLGLALARLHPQSRIWFVAHASKAKLAERVLGLESSDIESGWHKLFSGEALPPACQKLLDGAHSIYWFGAAPNLSKAAPAALVVPLIYPPAVESNQSVAENLAAQVEQRHPPAALAMRQILSSISKKGIGAARSGGEEIVIHPGSGAAAKCWTADGFLELIDRLKNDGRSVRILLGEVERDRMDPATLDRFRSAASTMEPEDYLDLHRILAEAKAFVGNDSGPAHLAGIIGVPTLAIFGPTSPAMWHPLGPMVRTLRSASPENMATLGVDAVYAEMKPLLHGG